MIFFADGLKQGSKNGDCFRIFSLTDFETFFCAATPVLDARGAHLLEQFFARLSEVDSPSVGGVKVVGFVEVK